MACRCEPPVRAVVFDRSLRFDPDHLDPRAAEGECLVRVHLGGICATDVQITRGYLNFSGILGHEMVGTVVEGTDAWRGRRVVCEINCLCRTCELCQSGLSNHCRRRTVIGIAGRNGFFADLVAVPECNLHAVPEVLSDEQAVFTEPLASAYQILVQCPIDARSNVTVVGSGRLGILAAQVLKDKGCRLNVVGRNEKKLLLCEKMGIETTLVQDLIPRQDRDVVVECSGAPEGLELAMRLVRPRGTIVLKSTYAGGAARNLSALVVDEVTLLGSRCGPFPEAIKALARQAVEVRAMISRVFAIEQAVEAFEAARNPDNIKILLKINPP